MPTTSMVNMEWIPALSGGALTIVAFVMIIFCLSKFGVLNKIIDNLTNRAKKNMEPMLLTLQKIDRNYDVLEGIHSKLSKIIENDLKNEIRLNGLEKQFRDVQLESFKKSVYDLKQPLSERMAAGLHYMKNSGNGNVKKFLMETLSQQDITQWNVLCDAMNLRQYRAELNQAGIDNMMNK